LNDTSGSGLHNAKETEESSSSDSLHLDLEAVHRVRTLVLELVSESASATSQMASFAARIRRFFDTSDDERARVVSDYAQLLQLLKKPENQRFAPAAEAGLLALRGKQFRLSSRIFDDIRDHIIRPSPLFYLIRGLLDFAVFVIMIFLFSLLVYVIFGLDASRKGQQSVLVSSTFVKIAISSGFGSLGAFVSIMQRLDHFVGLVDRPREYLRTTGFALPLIGGVLGALAAMVLSSNLLNVSIAGSSGSQDASFLVFAIVGFLAGYSERFSQSLVRLAEERLGYTASREVTPDERREGGTPRT
jgi:hypothetical protein